MRWHITPLLILRSYIFYFGQNDPIKIPILTISNALVKICQITHVIFQATSQFFFKSCITLHCHERWPVSTFLAQAIYTLLKRRLIKWKFLRLLSAQVTICQIPYVNLETSSRFLSNFWYPSSVSRKITPLYFFSSNNIYVAQKETIKVKRFETFECSGQNLSNCLRQFWNDKPIPLQILHPSSVSWKITRLYFFSINNVYFAQ